MLFVFLFLFLFLIFIYKFNYYLQHIWYTLMFCFLTKKISNKLEKNELIDESFVNNYIYYINSVGIVSIKLIQWFNTRIKILYDKPNVTHFLKKLDIFFDKCPNHNFEYTKKVYLQDFGKELEKDILINNIPIASGSIGQVYEGTLKNNGEKIAFKCVHPNINKNITVPKYILLLINYIAYLLNINIPVDIISFFSYLEQQTCMINETKNMIESIENLGLNDPIIIPKPLLYSKNILIMTYESGTAFDDLDISFYKKTKIINFLKIYLRSSSCMNNFCHGDLHNGNWKVRKHPDKNIYQLVFYDFGLCLRYNKDFIKNFFKIYDLEDIDGFILFLLKEGTVNLPYKYANNLQDILLEIKHETFGNDEDEDIIPTSFNEIILKLIPILTKKNIMINHIFLSSIIVIMLLQENFNNFTENMSMFTGEIKKYNGFKLHYPSMISYCNTYDCFLEYKDYMLEQLKEHKIDIDLFDGVEDKLNYKFKTDKYQKINFESDETDSETE